MLRSSEPRVGPFYPIVDVLSLTRKPIAKIGKGQLFQILTIKLVIVQQSVKTVLKAIPNMPNERYLKKYFAVFLKEFIAKPTFDSRGFLSHQKLHQVVIVP